MGYEKVKKYIGERILNNLIAELKEDDIDFLEYESDFWKKVERVVKLVENLSEWEKEAVFQFLKRDLVKDSIRCFVEGVMNQVLCERGVFPEFQVNYLGWLPAPYNCIEDGGKDG